MLPLDADNLLLPDAIERLVEQLEAAPARTSGSSTRTCSSSATATTTSSAPDYNLYLLLHGNYCDTCSLFDRAVFDAGRALSPRTSRSATRTGTSCCGSPRTGCAASRRRADAALPQVGLHPLRRGRLRARRRSTRRCARISPFVGEEERVKSAEWPSLTLALLHPLKAGRDGRDRHRPPTSPHRPRSTRSSSPRPRTPGEGAASLGRRSADFRPGHRGRPDGQRCAGSAKLCAAAVLGLSADPELRLPRRLVLRREGAAPLHEATGPPQVDRLRRRQRRQALRLPRACRRRVRSRRASARGRSGASPPSGHLPFELHADPADPVGSIARLFAASAAPVEWRHAPATDVVRDAAGAEGPRQVQGRGA